MGKIKLNLLRGRAADDAFLVNAEHFKKLSKEDTRAFIRWVKRFRVRKEVYTDDEVQKLSGKFSFKSVDEFASAGGFANTIFRVGPEIELSDLKSDLSALGFDQEKIVLILTELESAWAELDDWFKRNRLEALPIPVSLRWRVDIRYASSNYLRKPESIAILRIGTTDDNQIYLELDKDKISWFESTIAKIKRELLKSEEKLQKN